MTMSSHPVLPSIPQGMAQGEYAMSSSSVNIVTSADGFLAFAVEAAVIPAAPEPITMIFLAIWLTVMVIESILITILRVTRRSLTRVFSRQNVISAWMDDEDGVSSDER